ncbi:MAG: hypothetical protein LCH96_15415 [Actinobacteria bacterium]|nr:hypothetical protein [Actinomycetota bacterium]
MALLIEPSHHTTAARRHPAAFTAAVHLVPAGGVLVFPGAPDGIAPPAQLGPMMSPPGRERLFGR